MIIGGNPYYDVSPNATGTQILSTLTGDNSVFSFVGNLGSHGNAGLKNINITAATPGNGVPYDTEADLLYFNNFFQEELL